MTYDNIQFSFFAYDALHCGTSRN